MEQTNTGHGHGHTEVVTAGDHIAVPHRAAGLGNVLHAALCRTLNVILKGEERVRAQAHAGEFFVPSCLFLRSKGRRLLRKVPLPYAVCQQLIALRADIQVNGVCLLYTSDAADE